MTVAVDVAELDLATDGVTKIFNLTGEDGAMALMSPSDLKVWFVDADGAATALTYAVDYTVTGSYRTGGGVLTTTAADAYADGGKLAIRRNTPRTQPEAWADNDGFAAATMQNAQDRGRLIDQDVGAVSARSLRVPLYEDAAAELPAKSARSGKIGVWDDEGDFTNSVKTAEQLETYLTDSETVAAAAASAAQDADDAKKSAAAAGADLTPRPVEKIANDPDVVPTIGMRRLIGSAPTGDWAGHANQIAEYFVDGWHFSGDPIGGQSVHVQNVGLDYEFSGSDWLPSSSADAETIERHGAKGDYDGAAGTDNATAILAAIDGSYIGAPGGTPQRRRVKAAPGLFLFDTNLDIGAADNRSCFNFAGAGVQNTTLVAGALAGAAINGHGYVTTLADFSLDATAARKAGGANTDAGISCVSDILTTTQGEWTFWQTYVYNQPGPNYYANAPERHFYYRADSYYGAAEGFKSDQASGPTVGGINNVALLCRHWGNAKRGRYWRFANETWLHGDQCLNNGDGTIPQAEFNNMTQLWITQGDYEAGSIYSGTTTIDGLYCNGNTQVEIFQPGFFGVNNAVNVTNTEICTVDGVRASNGGLAASSGYVHKVSGSLSKNVRILGARASYTNFAGIFRDEVSGGAIEEIRQSGQPIKFKKVYCMQSPAASFAGGGYADDWTGLVIYNNYLDAAAPNTARLGFAFNAAGAETGGNIALVQDSNDGTTGHFSFNIPVAGVATETMQINSGEVATQVCRPLTDNTYNLGTASFRWKEVFSATGTINTSTRELKDNIAPISDALIDVFDEMAPQMWQYKDALALKGADRARLHVGFIVEDFEAACVKAGIDPHRYGLFCMDLQFEEVETGPALSCKQIYHDVETQVWEEDENAPPVVKRMPDGSDRPHPAMRLVTKTVKEPVFGADGEPTFEETPTPVLDAEGKQVMLKETRPKLKPDGSHAAIKGFRMEQFIALESASRRRREQRLQATLDALSARVVALESARP